jgi:hypothetical protein
VPRHDGVTIERPSIENAARKTRPVSVLILGGYSSHHLLAFCLAPMTPSAAAGDYDQIVADHRVDGVDLRVDVEANTDLVHSPTPAWYPTLWSAIVTVVKRPQRPATEAPCAH